MIVGSGRREEGEKEEGEEAIFDVVATVDGRRKGDGTKGRRKVRARTGTRLSCAAEPGPRMYDADGVESRWCVQGWPELR